MEYLWTKGVAAPEFPALEGSARAQVAVIGGGMAGILCALRLRQEGVDCIVLEGGKIGRKSTCGTTAVITAQHDVQYSKLIKTLGREAAAQYLAANSAAVAAFREMARRIPCDFEDKPSLRYSVHGTEKLKTECEALHDLGYPARYITKTPLPFEVAAAVEFPSMAQFHPLKFLYGAAEGLNVREHSFVKSIDGTTVFTDRGSVRADAVIVATHYPFINRRGAYFMKLYQKRSFVIALENAPDIGCTAVSETEGGIYLRNYGDLLLLGGGERRTGKKEGGFAPVRDFARRVFPGAREKYAWANQDCMSLDELPYIGRYSPAMPGVFVAAGFNEWGMTGAMVSSMLLTDMLTGRESPFAGIFRPDRSVFKPQLFINAAETVKTLLTPTAPRCPHMGCALEWNKEEKTWDCPCHGSRFTESGELIDNPATEDI